MEITNNQIIEHANEKDYSTLIMEISSLWDKAHNEVAVSLNGILLDTNWQIGRYIIEYEQRGQERATYGDGLLVRLSKDLTRLKGRGFSRSALTYMRKLYIAFPKMCDMSHKLTWSHYLELLKCDDKAELLFYYKETIQCGWTVRNLRRQIQSSLYERIALSTDKDGLLRIAEGGHRLMRPSDIIHDPYILEFTGLPVKKRIKESELEQALKDNMEKFLLELGRGFAFVGRQYNIPIGTRTFKVDLVFYHCILKCYVLIDLKRAEIKHSDIGQMNMYLNYFKTEICQPDDNQPIGIVLGAKKDEVLMEYAMQGITNQLFAAKYLLYLPKKEELQKRLNGLLQNLDTNEKNE